MLHRDEERLTPISGRFAEPQLLDEVGVGIFIVDDKGDLLATNAIADGLLRRRTAKGTLLDELLERARAKAPAESQELVEVEGDGGRRSIVGYRFVRSPKVGTIVTLRDITELERRRHERQTLERLSQVGRACAMVAHEIGNPLAALKATLQSVEQEAKAAGLDDTLGAVFREIERLEKILSQLLGFVRHRTPRRTRGALGEIVARARAAAGARLQGVTFQGIEGKGPDVLCDPDQIEQVLLNLFLNAADAMPGGGELRLRASTEGDHVAIVVEDTGPGVPPENRDRVFESFFTTKPAGVGLGLSVCLRIVTDHGGSIAIENRRGTRGAAVRITLPLPRGA
jgi:signal transduction histidine kinase